MKKLGTVGDTSWGLQIAAEFLVSVIGVALITVKSGVMITGLISLYL